MAKNINIHFFIKVMGFDMFPAVNLTAHPQHLWEDVALYLTKRRDAVQYSLVVYYPTCNEAQEIIPSTRNVEFGISIKLPNHRFVFGQINLRNRIPVEKEQLSNNGRWITDDVLEGMGFTIIRDPIRSQHRTKSEFAASNAEHKQIEDESPKEVFVAGKIIGMGYIRANLFTVTIGFTNADGEFDTFIGYCRMLPASVSSDEPLSFSHDEIRVPVLINPFTGTRVCELVQMGDIQLQFSPDQDFGEPKQPVPEVYDLLVPRKVRVYGGRKFVVEVADDRNMIHKIYGAIIDEEPTSMEANSVYSHMIKTQFHECHVDRTVQESCTGIGTRFKISMKRNLVWTDTVSPFILR